MNPTIAKNIRAFRENRAWPQEHLAQVAGVTTRTIQRAESGKGLSADTLHAVAAAFDVDVDTLRADYDAVQAATICENLGLSAEDLTKPEVVKAKFDEFEARYEMVPVKLVESAADFQGSAPAQAMYFNCIPTSDGVQDLSSRLEGELRDLMDAGQDVDPVGRRDALKSCFAHVAALKRQGAVVVAAWHEIQYELRVGSGNTMPLAVLYVVVAPVQARPLHLAVPRNSRPRLM